jgi:hypothetical protein
VPNCWSLLPGAGKRVFPSVVAEAIEKYLEGAGDEEGRRERALRLRGALSRKEAERLAREASKLRASWR